MYRTTVLETLNIVSHTSARTGRLRGHRGLWAPGGPRRGRAGDRPGAVSRLRARQASISRPLASDSVSDSEPGPVVLGLVDLVDERQRVVRARDVRPPGFVP